MDIITEKQTSWQVLKNINKPVIVYGMGNGADKVLDRFEQHQIICRGVMASDAFVRGQSFRGFKVKKLSEIEEEFSDFAVALAFASSLPEVMNNIYSVAEKHMLFVPGVPVFGDEEVDDNFINQNTSSIEKAFSLLADKQSREVFKGALNFYYSGRLSYLKNITTEKPEAFMNILKLSDHEKYLDLGAYRGDTIDEFLFYANNSYDKIIALEPDAKTFKKLSAHCEELKNIQLHNMGVWKENTTLMFDNDSARSSALSEQGKSVINVSCADTICREGITYIKADVEGAEKQFIEGAKSTLAKYKPKLNIAAYHRFSDVFNLILQINKINPDYKFYLRRHPYIPCWDLNLYCI